MVALSGETDSSDEGFEARVMTQKVELGIDFKPDQMTGAFFQRQFKPFESLFKAIETGADDGGIERGDVSRGGKRMQFFKQLFGGPGFACQRI